MMRIAIVGHGQAIEFDPESKEALSRAAAAFNMSVEKLKEEIQRLLQRQQMSQELEELEKLGELAKIAAAWIEELNYEFVNTRKKRVYCSYKPNMHKPDKRRCFKPKPYWQRIRSNPR